MKALLSIVTAATPALAQCSMCRTAAAAQGPGAMHAMNTAVLLLLLPALALFSAVFALAFLCARRSERGRNVPTCNKS
jgi:hypothetical protein